MNVHNCLGDFKKTEEGWMYERVNYGDDEDDGNLTVSDERSSFDFKNDDDDNVT